MTNKKDTRETIKNDKKAEKLPDPELKPESGNASGIIQNLLIFNSIRKDDDPACVTTNKTPRKIPVRGAAAGQKELSFEIELNSEDDPMVLVVQSPELEQYNDDLNLTINDDHILIEIDNEKNYGFCEFDLSNKVLPQFTVGSYDGGKLKLWLKRQPETGPEKVTETEPMIWCSENIMSQLDTEKRKAEENLEKFHQVQLDYQNYIVSTKREKEQTQNKFASELLLNIVDVQDNFDRALEASKKTRGKNILLSGVEMIRKQLEDVLDDNGVTEIPAAGTLFDPRKHEACATEKSSKMPEDTVIEVIQKGYMYKNKVLRLSKVKLAKPDRIEECK